MYFDSHAHLDDRRFDADRDEIFADLANHGVGLIMNIGCDLKSSLQSIDLAHKYPFVYAAVGSHPDDAAQLDDRLLEIYKRLCADERVKAIGEIGLDYHYEDAAPKEVQIKLLRDQLRLALDLDLPVVIHDREAHGDCLTAVEEFPALRGVFHCFSGSPEMAVELLGRGWYLGFDGPITYKNAKKALAVLAVTPPERILLETDAPYLPPAPHRGERNDSRFLPEIARAVAAAKGMDVAEVEALSWENGRRLFGI